MQPQRGILLMEQFTAVAPCPRCRFLDVHHLEEPNKPTGTPHEVELEYLKDDDMQRWFSALDEYGSVPVRRYDPPGATVARICRNYNHRWAQQ